MEIQDYLNLIPSANSEKPDFIATVSLNCAMQVRVQKLLESMIALFDIDTPPVGDQLDIVGKWVGASREVDIPISGVFFTWDGAASLGWDYGVWADGSETTITELPDDVYLTLIKATIAANNWDGTTEGAYAIWDSLLSGITIGYQDREDMSYDFIIFGGIVDTLTLALITGGYIKLRPEGVKINRYFISQGSNPVFAFDTSSTGFQGWDTGYWTTEITPT